MIDNIYEVDVTSRHNVTSLWQSLSTRNLTNENTLSKILYRFYGPQIRPLWDNRIKMLYKSWFIAVRRVWRLPWKTHCCLLPHLVGCINPELWFAKICIKFINMAFNSENRTVKIISKIGHSIYWETITDIYKLGLRCLKVMCAKDGMNLSECGRDNPRSRTDKGGG